MAVVGGERPNPIAVFHDRIAARMSKMPDDIVQVAERGGDADRVDLVAAGAAGVYGVGATVAIGTIASKGVGGIFIDVLRPDWRPIGGIFVPHHDLETAYAKDGQPLANPQAAGTALGAYEYFLDGTMFDRHVTEDYLRQLGARPISVGVALPQL